MVETELTSFTEALQQALIDRKDWLEKSELGKLKENLRTFQIAFASLYNIYMKKKLIDEDPYKQETKISELVVPDSGLFQETKRLEQLTIRLSNFDSQLDFLVNFYQLGLDFLNLERIKRIVGLIRYIDWVSFSPDSNSIMTKSVSEMTNQSKAAADPLTLSIIGECLTKLSKATSALMNTLKHLNTYYREEYKLSVRQNITVNMSANDVVLDNIKKNMHAAMPGSPFYKELIEELLKEDYSESGPLLKESILNSLKVADNKPKAVKPVINYKDILLNGIQVIGGASTSLSEITVKLDENHAIMGSHKKGFFVFLKELIRQITNAEPEEIVYNVEYFDTAKDITVKESVNFHQFQNDLSKKIKILSSFVRGPAYSKLVTMTEDQIIGYLEKNIKEVQSLHKILNALDDFFKTHAIPANRGKIKGIKPELSALKNTFVKANQIRHEYSAMTEEEEQMKRLGIGALEAK